MTITIIGHGYVGLVTAVVFADLGNAVWVIGRDRDKLSRLEKGDPIIYEPGLEELLKRNLQAERIQFTLDYKKPIADSKIVLIGVGTPPKNNGEADLGNVLKVAENIGKHINNYIVVACKSTVPVGTNRKVKKIIHDKAHAPLSKFDIASCPEFLAEGTALDDTRNPDRVVIGTESKRAKELLLELHKPIGGERVLTSVESAEMIKYAANALLATKISFANMIAFLSEKVGADARDVLTGVGLDRRIGKHHLYPGPGYGGSCLPKDVLALIRIAEKYDENLSLLKEVARLNNRAKQEMVKKIINVLGSKHKGKTIGILGLAFKANTDDIREAPALTVISALLRKAKGVTIKIFDPIVKQKDNELFQNVIYSPNPYDTAKDADILVIMTEWDEFIQLDLGKIKRLMRGSTIIDGRNLYELDIIKKLGFTYIGVGRKI